MICGSGLDRERSRTVWTLSGVEGVPGSHIVHFILDAVKQLPITDFRVNDRGTGSEQYPPRMMLALLIYCYATGRFGSRTIEAASYSDVAVRYLRANHHPDHEGVQMTTAFLQQPVMQFPDQAAFNPPISAQALEVTYAMGDIMQALDSTVTFRPRHWQASDALLDLVNETREIGWDGGDAAPVREETIAKVWALLAALPPQVPMPEISAEPDGDVALDWVVDRERQVSVSVRHNGELHFAGLFGGGRKVHGADIFCGAMPPMVLSAIKQLLG